MKVSIHFILIAEGSSDAGLVPHLENLCILCGADEVRGSAPDMGRLPEKVGKSVQAKVKKGLELEPSANLIFVHRDADSSDATPRYVEIQKAIATLDSPPSYVAVVPIQETEAWLLLDEGELRRVAQNPSGGMALSLPSAGKVESVARPKEKLQASLLAASQTTGRRREDFKKDFLKHRRLLLENLDPDGAIQQVPAWQRLRRDIEEAVASLRGAAASAISTGADNLDPSERDEEP